MAGLRYLGSERGGHHFDIVGIDNDKEFANRFGQKINALPTNPVFELGEFIPIPDRTTLLLVEVVADRIILFGLKSGWTISR